MCWIETLAEGVRFELTEAINLDGFQDRCLKPLGHPSIYGGVGKIRTFGAGFPARRFSKPLVSATHPQHQESSFHDI